MSTPTAQTDEQRAIMPDANDFVWVVQSEDRGTLYICPDEQLAEDISEAMIDEGERTYADQIPVARSVPVKERMYTVTAIIMPGAEIGDLDKVWYDYRGWYFADELQTSWGWRNRGTDYIVNGYPYLVVASPDKAEAASTMESLLEAIMSTPELPASFSSPDMGGCDLVKPLTAQQVKDIKRYLGEQIQWGEVEDGATADADSYSVGYREGLREALQTINLLTV